MATALFALLLFLPDESRQRVPVLKCWPAIRARAAAAGRSSAEFKDYVTLLKCSEPKPGHHQDGDDLKIPTAKPARLLIGLITGAIAKNRSVHVYGGTDRNDGASLTRSGDRERA